MGAHRSAASPGPDGEVFLSGVILSMNHVEQIQKDGLGYFFVTARQLVVAMKHYGTTVAAVHLTGGIMYVDSEDHLVHMRWGVQRRYSATELMNRIDDPPEGLRIILESDA